MAEIAGRGAGLMNPVRLVAPTLQPASRSPLPALAERPRRRVAAMTYGVLDEVCGLGRFFGMAQVGGR